MAPGLPHLCSLCPVLWECYNQLLESFVVISSKSAKLAEDYLMTTGSSLLLVSTDNPLLYGILIKSGEISRVTSGQHCC